MNVKLDVQLLDVVLHARVDLQVCEDHDDFEVAKIDDLSTAFGFELYRISGRSMYVVFEREARKYLFHESLTYNAYSHHLNTLERLSHNAEHSSQ